MIISELEVGNPLISYDANFQYIGFTNNSKANYAFESVYLKLSLKY